MGDRNLYASEVEAEATLALTQLIRLRKAWVGEWDPEKACANIYYIQSTIDGELTVSFISRYVYVEKYTLHGDTYYVAKGRSNLSLKREGDNSEDNFHCLVDKKTVFKHCHFDYFYKFIIK